jgi:hypothetical protein
MKISTIVATLTVGSTLIGQIFPAFAQAGSIGIGEQTAYKTQKGQVVVTKLQPKQKVEVKYQNEKGKLGNRNVKTNACGQVIISKAAKFQSLTVDNQVIPLGSIPSKEHTRCKAGQGSIIPYNK